MAERIGSERDGFVSPQFDLFDEWAVNGFEIFADDTRKRRISQAGPARIGGADFIRVAAGGLEFALPAVAVEVVG